MGGGGGEGLRSRLVWLWPAFEEVAPVGDMTDADRSIYEALGMKG